MDLGPAESDFDDLPDAFTADAGDDSETAGVGFEAALAELALFPVLGTPLPDAYLSVEAELFDPPLDLTSVVLSFLG